MAEIKFGPSGLGGKEEAISNLEEFAKKGLKCCEVGFTYSVYLKKDDAIEIGKKAKELGIFLSIHSQFFVNLNSDEKAKREATKKRILKCCEIGHYLSADGEKCRVVFHPGYYGKSKDKEKAFEMIKEGVLEIMKIIKKEKWNVEICAETMGKINVFGSLEEISRLAKETGCGFCIDFAHVMARYGGERRFEDIAKLFPQKRWQCHFSGIIYGDKGERKHKPTPKEEWEKLLKFLKGLDKEMVIVNESPLPLEDSLIGLKRWEKIK